MGGTVSFLAQNRGGSGKVCAVRTLASVGGTDRCGYSTYAMAGWVGHLGDDLMRNRVTQRIDFTIALFVLAAAAACLSGCASDVTVKMPLSSATEVAPGLAEVTVVDLRRPGIAASKREAAFGVPMGNITFEPPEAQIVKAMLETELSRLLRERGVSSKQKFSCTMSEFGVNTNTTPLYWDVMARVQLVLKYGDRDFPLNGEATERTFVWPGENIIRRVVTAALQQVSARLGPILQGAY